MNFTYSNDSKRNRELLKAKNAKLEKERKKSTRTS